MKRETWWDKRDFCIALGVAAMMTIGFLQGIFMGDRWEYVIPSYFTGPILAYVYLRSKAIREEKQDLAKIEALEKERDEKLRQLHELEQKVLKSMSMPPNSQQPPMQ